MVNWINIGLPCVRACLRHIGFLDPKDVSFTSTSARRHVIEDPKYSTLWEICTIKSADEYFTWCCTGCNFAMASLLGLSVDCTVVPRHKFILTLLPFLSVARNKFHPSEGPTCVWMTLWPTTVTHTRVGHTCFRLGTVWTCFYNLKFQNSCCCKML